MTEERLPLAELLAKAGDSDFLRSVAETVLQLLMEADVEGLIGAGRHERSGERNTYRNGYGARSASLPRMGYPHQDTVLRRISFAWRSSRISRFSALIRSRSSVVGPARKPRSRSTWRTQLRSVSPEQPIFDAIELIAAC